MATTALALVVRTRLPRRPCSFQSGRGTRTASRFLDGIRPAGRAARAARTGQGRGYGTEARAAVLDLAFGHLGALEALTEYTEGNHASERVSRKLGYVPTGQRAAYRDDAGPVTEYATGNPELAVASSAIDAPGA